MHQELHITALPPTTTLYNLLFMKITGKKNLIAYNTIIRLDHSRLIKNVSQNINLL